MTTDLIGRPERELVDRAMGSEYLEHRLATKIPGVVATLWKQWWLVIVVVPTLFLGFSITSFVRSLISSNQADRLEALWGQTSENFKRLETQSAQLSNLVQTINGTIGVMNQAMQTTQAGLVDQRRLYTDLEELLRKEADYATRTVGELQIKNADIEKELKSKTAELAALRTTMDEVRASVARTLTDTQEQAAAAIATVRQEGATVVASIRGAAAQLPELPRDVDALKSNVARVDEELQDTRTELAQVAERIARGKNVSISVSSPPSSSPSGVSDRTQDSAVRAKYQRCMESGKGWTAPECSAIAGGQVWRGMTEEMLFEALGQPARSEEPSLLDGHPRTWRYTFSNGLVVWVHARERIVKKTEPRA